MIMNSFHSHNFFFNFLDKVDGLLKNNRRNHNFMLIYDELQHFKFIELQLIIKRQSFAFQLNFSFKKNGRNIFITTILLFVY